LEGTDVDVEQNVVEQPHTLWPIELPDDDPVQCGNKFCFIYDALATNSGKLKEYPDDIWIVRIWTVKFPDVNGQLKSGQSKPG